jgi:hypothetical protein
VFGQSGAEVPNEFNTAISFMPAEGRIADSVAPVFDLPDEWTRMERFRTLDIGSLGWTP